MSSGELKLVLTHGCYSLITINFNLPRGVHIRNALHVLSTYSCELKTAFARGCYSLLTSHHYQLQTATCSSYQERFACSKYAFPQAKSIFSTWLLLTHHNEPHTATCKSYREGFACSKYAFLQAKTNFGT